MSPMDVAPCRCLMLSNISHTTQDLHGYASNAQSLTAALSRLLHDTTRTHRHATDLRINNPFSSYQRLPARASRSHRAPHSRPSSGTTSTISAGETARSRVSATSSSNWIMARLASWCDSLRDQPEAARSAPGVRTCSCPTTSHCSAPSDPARRGATETRSAPWCAPRSNVRPTFGNVPLWPTSDSISTRLELGESRPCRRMYRHSRWIFATDGKRELASDRRVISGAGWSDLLRRIDNDCLRNHADSPEGLHRRIRCEGSHGAEGSAQDRRGCGERSPDEGRPRAGCRRYPPIRPGPR
jgi:hypothetical protein